MNESEQLRWNDEPAVSADCGITVAPQKSYRLYADNGPRILCPACYQQRVMRDSGGATHDLIAEVDGGSG